MNTETNKQIVLQAFDTLFNKRDYTAAGRFWSPRLHPAQRAYGDDGSMLLLPPFLLGDLQLRNRIVVAPLTRTGATLPVRFRIIS